MKHKKLMTILLTTILAISTTSYIFYNIPRPIRAGQVNLSTGKEPRSLSDLINFTQKADLTEFQLTPFDGSTGDQALRTINRYFGTSPVYKEGCTKYTCPGGPPVPRDVETATIGLRGRTSPVGVGVNPTTNRVYVADSGSNSVSVIDGNSNTVLANVTVGSSPMGVAVNPTTNRIYVGNQGSNTVSVINGTSNTVIKNIRVAYINTFPLGISVNPITNRVYVPTNNVGVSVIDGNTNTVIANVTIAGFSAAVNPTTNRIYVADGGSSVSVINGTNAVIKTIPVGAQDYGIAVDPNINRVYVANFAGSSVSVINGTSNTVLTTISLSSTPFSVGVNPTTHRVYVTYTSSSSVTVINGTTNTILNTFGIGMGALFVGPNVAVNPTTNIAYVANGIDNTVSVISQREEVSEACLLAGTSCLLVSSSGTLFPGTPQATAVDLVTVSLHTNATKTGTQMALTIACDNDTTIPSQQCFAFYVDGNVWGPGQTDLSKSPFIIQNAEPYFYLQFHWWDFANSKIVAWGTWWYGTESNPNWYWGVYWWWRTYVNYYIGNMFFYNNIWLPWWWWVWHWTYWRYWSFWTTNSPT